MPKKRRRAIDNKARTFEEIDEELRTTMKELMNTSDRLSQRSNDIANRLKDLWRRFTDDENASKT